MKENLVRYQPSKTNGGPAYYEWTGVEFVARVAALIPPARKHMVRYYGALGPRSPLRGALTVATKAKATSAARRSWAACVKKVFEVDAVRCVKCGGEMTLADGVSEDGGVASAAGSR